jgi:hypothetical protein
LFAIGYTLNVIVHNGVLDPGVSGIMLRYTMDTLANKISAVWDFSQVTMTGATNCPQAFCGTPS